MNRHYQSISHFTNTLHHLKKSAPPGYRRIPKTIGRLLRVTDGADGKMVGLYHGRYKKEYWQNVTIASLPNGAVSAARKPLSNTVTPYRTTV